MSLLCPKTFWSGAADSCPFLPQLLLQETEAQLSYSYMGILMHYTLTFLVVIGPTLTAQ